MSAVVSGTTGSPTITTGVSYNGQTGTVYQFTQDGSITFSQGGDVSYLIVGGGGGGGTDPFNNPGGGGGGGGVIQSLTSVLAQSYPVTVGAGGQGGIRHEQQIDAGLVDRQPTNGGDSSVFSFTALGGGSGTHWNKDAQNGGSGGGGGQRGSQLGGAGTPGQGFEGADFVATVQAGGGGGAGAPGENSGVNFRGGPGGAGAQSSITGSLSYYGGGGGSSHTVNSGVTEAVNVGGVGGGGDGFRFVSYAQSGVDGTGGGGGGSAGNREDPLRVGGNGGSGVVILFVPGTPTIVDAQQSTQTSSLTHTAPTTTGSVGDLLLCVFSFGGNPSYTFTGDWSVIETYTSFSEGSNGEKATLLWRYADNVNDALEATSTTTANSNVVVYRFSGASHFTVSPKRSGGNGANVADSEQSPVVGYGGALDNLFLAVRLRDGVTAPSAVPSGFTLRDTFLNSTLSRIDVATMTANAASYAGGNWTSTADRWLTFSFCVSPTPPASWTWEHDVDGEPVGTFYPFTSVGELGGTTRATADVIADPLSIKTNAISYRVSSNGFGVRYNTVPYAALNMVEPTRLQAYTVVTIPSTWNAGEQIQTSPIGGTQEGTGTTTSYNNGIYFNGTSSRFELVSDRFSRGTLLSGLLPGSTYVLRYEVENKQIVRGKAWLYGSSEPAAWQIEHDNGTPFVFTKLGFNVRTDTAGNDNLFTMSYRSFGFDADAPAPTGGGNVSTNLTGVSATGEIGSATATGSAIATATGVSATGEVGAVNVSTPAETAIFSGWGRGAWSEGSWSTPLPITGVSATGQVGTATATGGAVTTATGVSATGEIGSATATGSAVASATGVSATGQVGAVTAQTDQVLSITGVSATGQVGTATATGGATAAVTGVSATGQVGAVVIAGYIEVFPDGVSATGQVGTATATGGAVTTATGVSATGQVGAATAQTDQVLLVTGVPATGQVGTTTTTTGQVVPVTGVSVTASVGGVLIWLPLLPNQSAGYGSLEPSVSDNWTPDIAAQSPGYSGVAPNQSAGYSSTTPSQSPDWDEFAA